MKNNQINKQLNITLWNANGLQNKIHELPYFLHKFNVDILLINETKLLKHDNINIKGYKNYRKDGEGNNRGGGVAIFIKNSLSHQEFHINTTLEVIAIEISDMLIITYYSPPQNKINLEEINNFLSLNKRILIAGDSNAKHQQWHCRTSKKNGRLLNKYINSNPISIAHPDGYTLYPVNSDQPSIVDIAIIKNITSTIITESLDELDSDHKPVIFKIKNTNVDNNTQEKLNYKKADWDKYRQYLNDNIVLNPHLHTTTEIDKSVETLTQTIQDAIHNSIPKLKINPNTQTLPDRIKELIKIRNKVNKKYQKTRIIKYKIEKNQITFEIKNQIKSFHNKLLENKLKTLNTKDHTLWNSIKLHKSKDNTIPILHGPNGLALDNQSKADAIADVFERVHYLTQDLSNNQTINQINNSYRNITTQPTNLEEIKLVTIEEIKTIIKSIKPKKAPGFDNIQNITIKNLPNKALVQLSLIYNSSIKLSHFPSNWKKAKILPFKKPNKDQKFPQNYRPISLLPTLGKLLEILINNRLNNYLHKNNLIIPEQFGFRKHHNTVQQLARLTDHISTKFNINKSTGLILLDIEKAFDTVWKRALIFKLNNINVPLYLTKLINNYLSNRVFQVTIKNSTSTSGSSRCTLEG